MAVIETVSGKFVDPEIPNPDDIMIEDMAWAISRISRFCGHTVTEIPYNVAQHSVFVSDMAYESTGNKNTALFALLHDCAEAYVGDVPSPVKHIPSLKAEFDRIEDNLLNTIFTKYVGQPVNELQWSVVKQFDRRACQIEAHWFMVSRGIGPQWGDRQDISLIELQSFPQPEPALISYQKFMTKYNELKNQ